MFNENYYNKTYKEHSKMDNDLYGFLNMKSNEIIESGNVKFFENLIMKDKEYEILTNKESHEEGSLWIVETQPELRISKSPQG